MAVEMTKPKPTPPTSTTPTNPSPSLDLSDKPLGNNTLFASRDELLSVGSSKWLRTGSNPDPIDYNQSRVTMSLTADKHFVGALNGRSHTNSWDSKGAMVASNNTNINVVSFDGVSTKRYIPNLSGVGSDIKGLIENKNNTDILYIVTESANYPLIRRYSWLSSNYLVGSWYIGDRVINIRGVCCSPTEIFVMGVRSAVSDNEFNQRIFVYDHGGNYKRTIDPWFRGLGTAFHLGLRMAWKEGFIYVVRAETSSSGSGRVIRVCDENGNKNNAFDGFFATGSYDVTLFESLGSLYYGGTSAGYSVLNEDFNLTEYKIGGNGLNAGIFYTRII